VAITDRPVWGSDVPISMPLPAPEPQIVPMFGWAMTQFRLVHAISQADYENLAVPVYAPDQPSGDVVADDAAIDSGQVADG
jgi:hypothetical protein